MLQRTAFRRLAAPTAENVKSYWDLPFFEAIPFFKHWKMNTSWGGFSPKEIPRTVHGFHEMTNPRSSESCKYFPYRQDLTINNVPRMTVSQMLAKYYFPSLKLDDDQRVGYIALKTGRSEQEIAQEIFRMRRVRLACAQSLRNKLRGMWFRMPVADWTPIEKEYLNATLWASQVFGMDFYCNACPDPYVIWSPYYLLGENLDTIVYKQIRTANQFLMVEIVVHQSIPIARFPDCKEPCADPIKEIEPCLFEFLRLKLAICALLAKMECYVTDHFLDQGHQYHAALVHLHREPQRPNEVIHEVIPVDLDLKLAQEVLDHYFATQMAAKGFTGLKY